MSKNKTVLITGASRGIGIELAKQFLELNYRVIVVSRSKPTLLKLTDSKNFFFVKCNFANIENIKIISNFLKKQKINNIDILINNAGLLINKPLINTNYKEALEMFNVNFFAAAFLIKELIPFLGKSKGASHVINITSMGGFQGSVKYQGLSFYSASKAALAIFTECLAEELKNKNIKCNALALGAVQTEMLSKAFPNYKAPIEAQEIATFIKEFSLNSHNFINGKIIPVSLSTP
jgi:short-subunit dehydrogenase